MSESDASDIVLELAEEFLERYRKGERPSLKEYIDRHPDLSAESKEVFPAMTMMENIAVRDSSLAELSFVESSLADSSPYSHGDASVTIKKAADVRADSAEVALK